MELRFRQQRTKDRPYLHWHVQATGCVRPGVGMTQADAMDSLVRSNLAAFGVTTIETTTVRRGPDGKEREEHFRWSAEGSAAGMHQPFEESLQR